MCVCGDGSGGDDGGSGDDGGRGGGVDGDGDAVGW